MSIPSSASFCRARRRLYRLPDLVRPGQEAARELLASVNGWFAERFNRRCLMSWPRLSPFPRPITSPEAPAAASGHRAQRRPRKWPTCGRVCARLAGSYQRWSTITLFRALAHERMLAAWIKQTDRSDPRYLDLLRIQRSEAMLAGNLAGKLRTSTARLLFTVVPALVSGLRSKSAPG